jgi:hypothetical protein
MAQPNQYDAVLGGRSPGPRQGSAVMGTTNRYFHLEHRQFCLDMAAAQLPVSHNSDIYRRFRCLVAILQTKIIIKLHE